MISDFGSYLIRNFPYVYGPSLVSPTLRHAVLTIAAMKLPSQQFSKQTQHHRRRAYRELAIKLKTPSLIDETDIFAAYLLTFATAGSDFVSFGHLNGCLSMLKAFRLDSRDTYVSDLFSTFAVVLTGVLSVMGAYEALLTGKNFQWSRDGFLVAKNFTKFVKAAPGFWPVSTNATHGWQCNLGTTIGSTLGIVADTLSGVVLFLASSQLDLDKRPSLVEEIVQHVFEDLNDPEFLDAMETAKQWSEPMPTEYVSVKYH